MALSVCRTSARLAAVLACLTAGASCSSQVPQPAAAASELSVVLPDAVGVELPAGAGRGILLGACLSCHDLGGLALFKGFYTRDRWQELVVTMVSQGAVVDAAEIELLADYLAQHFGPD